MALKLVKERAAAAAFARRQLAKSQKEKEQKKGEWKCLIPFLPQKMNKNKKFEKKGKERRRELDGARLVKAAAASVRSQLKGQEERKGNCTEKGLPRTPLAKVLLLEDWT